MIDTANTIDLKDKTEWNDQKSTFENFLRVIPGRNSIHLLYIIRDDDIPILDPSADIHQYCINRSLLTDGVFASDASVVHTYIVKFIAENTTA